jgi:hypothetical protein
MAIAGTRKRYPHMYCFQFDPRRGFREAEVDALTVLCCMFPGEITGSPIVLPLFYVMSLFILEKGLPREHV